MLKCPNCGSKDCDNVASWGGDGEPIEELYVCFNCDTQFIATYNYAGTKVYEG